jgi:hypothetical protein
VFLWLVVPHFNGGDLGKYLLNLHASAAAKAGAGKARQLELLPLLYMMHDVSDGVGWGRWWVCIAACGTINPWSACVCLVNSAHIATHSQPLQ